MVRITSNIYEPVEKLLQTVSQRDNQRLSSASL